MNPKKLLVAGVVFVIAKAITDEIVKEMDLSGEAKDFVGWGVSAVVSTVAHKLV